jgi:uncharacterized protein YndB with AHSA1/START domain
MTQTRDQIAAVQRGLGLEERDGRDARVMTASQTYDAEIADVWDAITNAERIPRWFLPISGELRLGGRYRLEGNAEGTILHCDAPSVLAVTWEYGGEVSWVDARLSAASPGRTTLEVRHVAHVDDERWDEFGPGAVGIGWDMILLGLAQHLSGAPTISPENSMTWMVSEDGKAFMIASGELWRDADIASGTDAATASAAADRCIAAYTASPEDAGTES